MNLEELGEYKHKVATLLANDENIIEALLGDVSQEDDTDEMLLGNSSSKGHIYEFEYVPDINETTDTFICMETVVASAPTDASYRVYLYVFPCCHKKIMESYKKPGMYGTKADMLAVYIDKKLNGSKEFGIGRVRLISNDVYKPIKNYYGRCITYEVVDFNRKIGK